MDTSISRNPVGSNLGYYMTSFSGNYMIFAREINRLRERTRYLGDAHHTCTPATNCYKLSDVRYFSLAAGKPEEASVRVARQPQSDTVRQRRVWTQDHIAMSHASLSPYQGVHAFGLGNLLREQARGRPHFTAVSDGEHLYSFAELDDRVNRLASVLRARGVGKGDRILWLGQNSFRVFEVLLAGARLGAIVCPANWRASAHEVAQTLDDFDPKVVFWQDAEIGALNREARKNWRPGINWICHDGCDEGDNYEALIAEADPAANFESVPPTAPLLAIYTAAFSGRPAAALLSHESLLIVAWLSMFAQKIDENTSYLVSGPMFHVGVLMGALGTLMAGGRCLFVARVDAEDMLKRIAREKLTHAYIAPPTIEQMRRINADGKYDVSRLFSDPQMSEYQMPLVMPRAAPMLRSINGYGQTEIGGLV